MILNHRALFCLLARAHDEARCTPADSDCTLTVHLAERGGTLVAAAVLETHELRVSQEWAA